jgi:hypothetical protein
MKDLSNLKKSMIDFRKERAEKRADDLDLTQVKNDDLESKNYAALYGKCLEHDPTTGLPSSDNIDRLITALETGEQADFDAIELSATATRKLESPQAALSQSISGGEPEGFTMRQAPALNSREAACEMMEVYERNILRDISFRVISGDDTGTGPEEADLTRAIATLNAFGDDYKGPKIGGVVTRKSLFRGVGEGELVGPYVSQFLVQDINLGAHTIVQQSLVKTGVYGITEANWLAIQNGAVPVPQTTSAALYTATPRVLGSFVHIDFVYQAFLYASAYLLGNGAQRNEAFPMLAKETNFVNSSGPADIAAAIGEISRHALKATWVQKWRKHLRLRPEAMAGRIVKEEAGDLPVGTVHPEVFTTGLNTINAVKAANVAEGGDNAAWLPLQYAEGSPTHPSYNAGHAGIAGACAALLKMYFKDGAWSSLGTSAVESVAGLAPVAYAEADVGDMTIHGEINKLASNMAYGRDFSGVHYRIDGSEGILLGEKVAIQWMKDNAAQSNVNIGTIEFTSADGVTKQVVKTN